MALFSPTWTNHGLTELIPVIIHDVAVRLGSKVTQPRAVLRNLARHPNSIVALGLRGLSCRWKDSSSKWASDARDEQPHRRVRLVLSDSTYSSFSYLPVRVEGLPNWLASSIISKAGITPLNWYGFPTCCINRGCKLADLPAFFTSWRLAGYTSVIDCALADNTNPVSNPPAIIVMIKVFIAIFLKGCPTKIANTSIAGSGGPTRPHRYPGTSNTERRSRGRRADRGSLQLTIIAPYFLK